VSQALQRDRRSRGQVSEGFLLCSMTGVRGLLRHELDLRNTVELDLDNTSERTCSYSFLLLRGILPFFVLLTPAVMDCTPTMLCPTPLPCQIPMVDGGHEGCPMRPHLTKSRPAIFAQRYREGTLAHYVRDRPLRICMSSRTAVHSCISLILLAAESSPTT
jgi:hypothetical protein